MTFRQFAVNNVIRNKRLYVAYFLSSLFTVMVFFTFAIFAFHPAFSEGSVGGEVLYGMAVASGIIYVFSFFFVLYSMSSFLQSRKKEFGLLIIQGMTAKQIRLMVFLENMLIGLIATLGGIALGLVFAKVILLLAEYILVIDETLNFYFPTIAIIVTFVSFLILFMFISIFVTFILRTKKLTSLIKADQQSKGEPKASVLLSLIAALLLIGGYGVALYVEGFQVVAALLPVVGMVTLGTYLFFTQLSVYVIRRLKRNKSVFWRKTNMILFSDLSFRMKDNARTFFMVAMISTVAFSAIGTLYGFQSFFTKGVTEGNPYSYLYITPTEDEAFQDDIQLINSTLEKYHIQAKSKGLQLNYFSIEDETILIVKQSDYNSLAGLLGKMNLTLAEDEMIVVSDSSRVLESQMSDRLMNMTVQLEDGTSIKAARIAGLPDVLPEMYAYYVIHDDLFEKLPVSIESKTTVVWLAEKGQEEKLIQAGEEIFDQIGGYKFAAIDFSLYQFQQFYGPTLFIGLFIGIVFFVSAGSFLYFRLYSDLDHDKEKFKAIAKIGLTSQELKSVIDRQIFLLFFAPIVVALLHGAVALTALSHMFDYSLIHESMLVLGAFALIQVVYFVIVRYFYTREIEYAVF